MLLDVRQFAQLPIKKVAEFTFLASQSEVPTLSPVFSGYSS